MDAEQQYILDRNVIMIFKSSIETIVSKLGYPSISHTFINYFTDSQFDIASSTRISSDCILRGDIDLSNKTRLASKCKLEGDISVGRRTNLEPDCEVIGNVSIGNFCAIARRNLVQQTNHEMDKPALQMRFYEEVMDTKLEHTSSGPVDIGHDVWIGAQSIVLSGVSVGDGAIIGAGSVVTKDVEPYAVVAGAPAERVKWRFPAEIRERLRSVAWWQWSDDKIRDNSDFFNEKIDTVDDIPI